MEPSQVRSIVAAAKRGSPQGYQQLLEAYRPRLMAYFLRATGRVDDAEDLMGELSLRLVRRLEDYEDRGRFEPWLFRIAANMVRDRIRRWRASPPPLQLGDDEDAGPTLGDIAGADQPVDAALLAEELSDRLKQALAKLDDTSREMILLRHYGQMSFKEIAQTFECPIGTALAKVHRGLRTLRRLMGDDDDDQ